MSSLYKRSTINIIKTIPGDVYFHLFEKIPEILYPPQSIRRQQPEKINADFLHQCFVLEENGKTLARAALYNNPHLHYIGKKAACVGYYECVNDDNISCGLLSAVMAEAKALGAQFLIGPMNGSTWNDYRFNEDDVLPPFFTEVVHPLYYNRQFADFGFKKIAKYISGISDCTQYEPIDTEAVKSLYDKGLRLRNIRLDRFEDELNRLYAFCTEAFKNNFLYTPIGAAGFKEKYRLAKKIIRPGFFQIAEDNGGNIIGFIFCLDDFCNRKEKNLIIKTVARLPGKEWKGFTTLAAGRMYAEAREKGYRHVLHAFMHEKNASVQVSKKFTGTVFRNYALYGSDIA